MSETELKRLTDDYKEAKDCSDLLSYPPYLRFAARLEENVALILAQASSSGFETVQLEHDALERARTYRKALDWTSGRAKALPRLAERLASSGVALDVSL